MGNEGTPGAAGHREKLIAGGAVASAGILALSLVVVPPDFDGATAQARAVRLIAVSQPAVTPWEAALERLTGNRSLTVVPASQTARGALDIKTPAVTNPLLLFRTEQRTGSPTQAISANDGATVVAAVDSQALQNIALGPKMRQVLETAVGLVAAGAIVVVFAIGIPVSFVLSQIYQLIDRIRGVPTELAASETLTPDVALKTSEPAAFKAADPVDTPTNSEPVTPTATTTGTQQTSTNDVTDTSRHGDAPTELTESSGAELSASSSTSKSEEPPVRSTTQRRVVRSPLGVREQLRNLTQRVTGGHSTTRTADDGGAAAAESSSATSSSAASPSAGGDSSGGSSSGGDSSGDDAGGS